MTSTAPDLTLNQNDKWQHKNGPRTRAHGMAQPSNRQKAMQHHDRRSEGGTAQRIWAPSTARPQAPNKTGRTNGKRHPTKTEKAPPPQKKMQLFLKNRISKTAGLRLPRHCCDKKNTTHNNFLNCFLKHLFSTRNQHNQQRTRCGANTFPHAKRPHTT